MLSRTMGEPVTQGQFFEAVQQLQDKIDAKHTSIRQYVGERSDKLEAAMKLHADEDRLVADRVLVIETQRADEARAAIKHGAWAGIVAAAGVTGMLEAAKHALGWK